jgi:hypothetical protein
MVYTRLLKCRVCYTNRAIIYEASCAAFLFEITIMNTPARSDTFLFSQYRELYRTYRAYSVQKQLIGQVSLCCELSTYRKVCILTHKGPRRTFYITGLHANLER